MEKITSLKEKLAEKVETEAAPASPLDNYFNCDDHFLMMAQDSHDLRMDGLLPGYEHK